MDPQPISMVSSPNTYLERLSRLFYNDYSNSLNYEGLLLIFAPFVVFVIVILLIGYHSSNKKLPFIYAVIVSILYLIYIFGLLPKLMYVI